MTEIFRFLLIQRLHKSKALSDDTATNLLSWPHSGFHVHASEPFFAVHGKIQFPVAAEEIPLARIANGLRLSHAKAPGALGSQAGVPLSLPNSQETAKFLA